MKSNIATPAAGTLKSPRPGHLFVLKFGAFFFWYIIAVISKVAIKCHSQTKKKKKLSWQVNSRFCGTTVLLTICGHDGPVVAEVLRDLKIK